MSRCRWLIALLVMLGMAAESRAQIIVPNGVVPGIGFRYRNGHRSVSGFISSGMPVVPGVPWGGPFFGSFGPPVFVPPMINGYALPSTFSIPTYGAIDSHTTVNIIVPTIVQGSRNPLELGGGVNRGVDLSGVDLDVVGPEALQPGFRPGLAKAPVKKPAAKVEVAKQAPADKAKPKPEPVPPKVEVAKLQPKPAKPVFPPPKLDEPDKAPKKELMEENQRLLELGINAFQAKEYGLAAHRFRQAVEAEPAQGRGYFLLAQANLALGKYKDAVAAIENGMKRQHDWPLSDFHPRQDLYKGMDEDWAAHKKLLEEVQAKQPKQGAFLFLQAYQLWFEGERERAAELFRQARPQVGDPSFIDRFLKVAAK